MLEALILHSLIKLRKVELRNLYSSEIIVSMIKSRKLKWVGHVACMGRGTCIQ
jgi:hypothetical protein